MYKHIQTHSIEVNQHQKHTCVNIKQIKSQRIQEKKTIEKNKI